MDNPYDVSDSERIERDWQQEQRAQSRFLDETYNWVPVCENYALRARKRRNQRPCGSFSRPERL